MHKWIWPVVLGGLFVALFAQSGPLPETSQKGEPKKMLVHGVYFELKDDSDAEKKRLVDLCEKYLTGHDGTVSFGAGLRGKEFDREVNDQAFDMALYVVFEDTKAHDKYQEHPRHLKFIEEGKDNWKKVRVFDSYLDVSSVKE